MDISVSASTPYIAVGGYTTAAIGLNDLITRDRAAIILVFEYDDFNMKEKIVVDEASFLVNGSTNYKLINGIKALKFAPNSDKIFGIFEEKADV